MYVTISKTCTRFKHAFRFIIVLIGVQDDGAAKVLRRMNYLIQEVVSERNTFPHYRASQSRGSTRELPFTTRVKPIIKHVYSNFHVNKLHVYLILYTRLLKKLNLFEIVHYKDLRY